MEPLSEQRLAAGIPVLALKVKTAHDKMLSAIGNGFRVAQCVRSYQDSDADYAKGRTAPGPKVTDAPGGYSWHNFGMAVDCYPFTAGDSGALDWNPSDHEFQQMVQFMKAGKEAAKTLGIQHGYTPLQDAINDVSELTQQMARPTRCLCRAQKSVC